ncbi:Rv3235 family protein [Streptomyces sp. RFCAC02]|uniref:Rv3235 family protein n=1 Tax=Streptomyces sp. RFCAC02 TaxID=2499143 RepID=UPI001F0FB853|nr:Rv3235 family protein [Streptomyces sp. RFCAC02]
MRTDSRGPSRAGPPRRSDTGRPQRALTPAARPAAHPRPQDWFAEQLLLVLSGRRPVHALLGHARAVAYDQLVRLAPGAPLRPSPGERCEPALRAVGVCRPGPGVIEAFARIAVGDRTRALAFRLERTPTGRWMCCAIELDTVA